MLATFLTGPTQLMEAAIWVFLVVVPLIWLDDHLKVRRALKSESSGELQRLGGEF